MYMRVDYSIVIDNEHAIWRTFDNAYWSAALLRGRKRTHHQFGKGNTESPKFLFDNCS